MIGLAMTFITYLLAPALSSFFKEERLTDIIRLLSLTFLINSAKCVQRNLMVRDMRFAELAKMDGGAHILTSLCALLLAYTGFGVWTLAIQYLLRNLILFVWAFLYERTLPGKIRELSRLKEMISFGAGISGSNLLFSIIRNIDSLIVGKLLGKITLGYYSFAQVLANKPFVKVLTIFNQVFFPIFSKIQDDYKKRREYFFRIMQLEILILTPIFVTLILIAPELVYVVLGNKWQLMVIPLQVFSGIAIFKYIENRINTMFNSSGNSRPQFIYLAALAPIIAATLFAGAKFFGINGVLTAWGGIYPIVFVFYLRYLLVSMDIKWLSFLSIWKVPTISTIAMVIGVCLFSLHPSPNQFINLLIKAMIPLIIYLVINYFLNKKVLMELTGLVMNKSHNNV
jgi:O-antigen/teichoic acid export membrane protein